METRKRFSIRDLVDEAQREAFMRHRVYPEKNPT